MRVHIAAVGRLKAGPERDLAARYLERFAHTGAGLGLEAGRVREIAESRAGTAALRKRQEAEALARSIPAEAVRIVLDETGRVMTSRDFAETLALHRDAGRRDLVLAIGGPDGHDAGFCAAADATIALGRMTWPHQIVRILLAEQLYRAATILAGHPYHRA